ncbi:MAG: hypothetical protein ACOVO0_11185, partial [Burkholderiaceae bacterium]
MTQDPKQLTQQLHVNRPHGLYPASSTFKLRLLVFYPQSHVPDDGSVFASQTLQLLNLLCQVANPAVGRLLGVRDQPSKSFRDGIHQQRPALTNDVLD